MDFAPDERTGLREMLDYYRAVFARKMHGLDGAQLAQTLGPSSLTLGGLFLHMAGVEDGWFDDKFAGNDPPSIWADVDWEENPDWELDNAHTFTPEQLLAQFNESVERSRTIEAAATSLDQLTERSGRKGDRRNLRWIMIHMIEEYARHCGNADFLREAVDGVTGD